MSATAIAVAVALGASGPAGATAAATSVVAHGVSGDAVPGRPTHLTARVRDHQVILRWHAPKVTATTGAPRDYLVIWQAPPMLPLTAEVNTHSTLTSYTSTFGPGTYEVEAKNRSGVGPPSKPVTVTGT